MKSIKEKAEELYPTNKYNINLSDVHRKEGFEKGANYVLDEIECILMDKELDCEETCDELVALIEQLKK